MAFQEFIPVPPVTNAFKSYSGQWYAAATDLSGNTYLVGKPDNHGGLPSFHTANNVTLVKISPTGAVLNGTSFNPPSALTSIAYYDVAYDKTNDRIALHIGNSGSVVVGGQTYYCIIELNSNGTLNTGLTSATGTLASGSWYSGGFNNVLYQATTGNGTVVKLIYYYSGSLYVYARQVFSFYQADYYKITLSSNLLTNTSSLLGNLDSTYGNSISAAVANVYKQDPSSEIVCGTINYGNYQSQVYSASGIGSVHSCQLGSSFNSTTQPSYQQLSYANNEMNLIGTNFPYVSGVFDNNNVCLRFTLSGTYSESATVGNSTGSGAAFNNSSSGFWAGSNYRDVVTLSDGSSVYYSSQISTPVTWKGSTITVSSTSSIVKINSAGNVATWSLPGSFGYTSSSDCISDNGIKFTLYRVYNDNILFVGGGNGGTSGQPNFAFMTDSSGNVIWA